MVMIFTLLPMSAFAENGNATTEPTMDVGGSNSVGKLISNEVTEQGAEQAAAGSHISDLVINGNTATVTFMTDAAECDIVVGIYDENNEAYMLASGTAAAHFGDSEISVELSGSMPESFIATAYMLERETHSPLCEAYTTQMYTSEMQAFLATTVNDYDKELVLNLDENEETNFAVFNGETLRISESDGMSVEDKGNGTYIVSNADDSVKSLSKGDEFAFTYDDGTVLLVSVASVKVNGNTVTITEASDADLQDFFDYVKIEGSNDSSSEASIDTSCMDESVTLVNDSSARTMSTYARDIDKEGSYGSSFSVNLNHDKVKGSLTFGYEISLKVYVTVSYKYVSLTADFTQSLSVTLSIIKKEIPINLPTVDVYIIPGVYAHLKTAFVAEASVSLEWTGEIKTTIGFAYDSDIGFVNKCSSPSCDSKLELSGKVFLGMKISLGVEIISDEIASAGIESKAGAELSANVRLDKDNSGSIIHDCDKCLEGSISAVISLTAKANFLRFEVENTFAEYKQKISDFYSSATFGDDGWGTCPHISYKVSLTVLDKDGNPAPGAIILCDGLNYCPNVDSKGVASFYLPNGEYSIHIEANGQTADKNITVHDTGKEISIRLAAGAQSATSDKCGDNLTWTIDSEGTLTISGTGAMYNYEHYNDIYAPWYDQRSTVKKVVIKSGVTSIGGCAFFYCERLTSISIPNSVTSIGERAFFDCERLTSISIPNSVTSIGEYAFSGCDGLTSISIPNSVTSIGEYAFYFCTSLTSIDVANGNPNYSSYNGALLNKEQTVLICCPGGKTEYSIPDSVTSIVDFAFFGCDGLTSISIPNKVTSIGDYAFEACDGLTSISIPDGVTSIGAGAFSGCDGLTSISIPDSVTSIRLFTFRCCSSLTSITIPNSVTSIGAGAFSGCDGLTSISIPDSVTSIGNHSFEYCYSLTDVYYSGTKDQWNKISIGSYNSELTNANIHFNSTAPASMAAEAFTLTKNPASAFSAESLNTGETGIKTSRFSNLQPGVQYVFIVVLDPEAEAYLGSDNLCYIAQKQADASGTLSFSYYSDAENASESIHALHIHDYADGVCDVCGAKDPDYEPTHTHSYSATVTAPTCTEKGYTTHTCACGDRYKDSYVNALGHNYKDGVCTVCGAKDPDYKPPVKENPFVDVSESSVYYDAILWAYYHEPQQITGGYTATEFRPGNPCTRGQVVTFLWRAAGCPEPTGDINVFNDASSIAAPYRKAVAWAVEKGITTGFTDGTFRPNDSVTRAQFVTFLWRYENKPATSGSIAGFTDAASISGPYQQAVAWAVEKGITTGYNDGSFRPNDTCTRWAVVLFMHRDME